MFLRLSILLFVFVSLLGQVKKDPVNTSIHHEGMDTVKLSLHEISQEKLKLETTQSLLYVSAMKKISNIRGYGLGGGHVRKDFTELANALNDNHVLIKELSYFESKGSGMMTITLTLTSAQFYDGCVVYSTHITSFSCCEMHKKMSSNSDKVKWVAELTSNKY